MRSILTIHARTRDKIGEVQNLPTKQLPTANQFTFKTRGLAKLKATVHFLLHNAFRKALMEMRVTFQCGLLQTAHRKNPCVSSMTV